MAQKNMHNYIPAGVRCRSLKETIRMFPVIKKEKEGQSVMLEYSNKSDSLRGLPNTKGNIRPYIAFSDRSRYRILVNRINC